MSVISSFQKSAQTSALAVVSDGAKTATSLQASYDQHFPGSQSLAAVRQAYTAVATANNESLTATVNTTVDATQAVLTDIAVLTQYITLTIPKMEDGGNWGVSVQLAAIKAMGDSKEKLEKGLEELTKYASTRADALDKCKLLSTSKTTSTSKSQSTSEGTSTEKGDAKATDSKTSTEEKETTTAAASGLEIDYRVQAVVATDVLYYTKAKAVFQNAIMSYLAAVDFCDKNSDKLSQPKGNSGGTSSYSSMY